MDMDTATDPDTLILIRLCSDLCCTVRVNGWACPFIFVTSCALSFHFFLLVEKSCLRSAKPPKKKWSGSQNWSVKMFLCMTEVPANTVMCLSFPIFGKVSQRKWEQLAALLLP